jgi:hypothetical protein
MNASSPVSTDSGVGEEGFGVYSFAVDPNQDIEGAYIAFESTAKMLSSAKDLPLLHRKILKLKGVSI